MNLRFHPALLTVASVVFIAPAGAGAADAETYKIDATHSTALFGVTHQGAGRFYGRFNDIEGTVTYADDSESDLSFDVTIKAKSIDSGSKKLDKHLRSPDFFNTKEHPKLTFKSTFAKKVGDKMYEVVGDMTLLGVTKSVTARVEWIGTHDGGRGKRCGFEAELVIKRSEFGMNYGVSAGALGDDTRIIVAMESVAGAEQGD